MTSIRSERLSHVIQEKISSFILDGRIKDKRVSAFLSITRVDVSGDLSYADVHVSDVRGKNIERGVEGLQSAAGFIQSQLGQVTRMKKLPKLRFHADMSVGEGFDLIKKIEKLTEPEKNPGENAEEQS